MNKKIIVLFALVAGLLQGCGGSDSSSSAACQEDGPFACQSGKTEPLYALQWALNSAESIFNTIEEFMTGVVNPNMDLNVEPVHLQGIKGQGVNVIVLDDGLEVEQEDLKANVDRTMTFNFLNQSNDPTPTNPDDAHGTNVAGIIAAAQNGIGIMGIAPRVRLGGANYLAVGGLSLIDAMGGSEWSKRGHIFNGSFGSPSSFPVTYDETSLNEVLASRNLVLLREGRGAFFVKAAGNQFARDSRSNLICVPLNDASDNPIDTETYRPQSCDSPINDPVNLEPTTLGVAALNAKAEHASYSSAGSTIWISGYAGELVAAGKYGESNTEFFNGPNMFSTDLTGCVNGYSWVGASEPDFQIAGTPTNTDPRWNNSNCNYSVLNGTSAAAPSISGVVALILQANPGLSWRDVRFILAKSARIVDADYRDSDSYLQFAYDMSGNRFSANHTAADALTSISNGNNAVQFAPVELGWVTNAAGYRFSNWFGFGLPDTAVAVEMAKNYTTSLGSAITYPAFADTVNPVDRSHNLTIPSGELKPVAMFFYGEDTTVDTLQLTLTGDANQPFNDLCLGRLALYVVSPGKTVSLLQPFNNIFSSESTNQGVVVQPADSDKPVIDFGLASVAFYGEKAKGIWTIYAGLVNAGCGNQDAVNVSIKYRIIQ